MFWCSFSCVVSFSFHRLPADPDSSPEVELRAIMEANDMDVDVDVIFSDLAARAGSMVVLLERWGRLDEVDWPAARMVIEGGMSLPDEDYYRKQILLILSFFSQERVEAKRA